MKIDFDVVCTCVRLLQLAPLCVVRSNVRSCEKRSGRKQKKSELREGNKTFKTILSWECRREDLVVGWRREKRVGMHEGNNGVERWIGSAS